MKTGFALLLLAAAAIWASAPSSAQGEAEVCTCTCSLKRKDGTRLVISTVKGESCSPCDDSCCGALCAPILQEELARRRAARSVTPADPAAVPSPPTMKAGSGATPAAGSSPPSARPAKTVAPVDKRIAALEALIKGNGASPKAVAEVRRQLEVMLIHVEPAVLDRLADKKIVIELVPAGKELGDLDDFKKDKDTIMPDLRKFGELPGVTELLDDGTAVSAFREDNMLGTAGYAHQDFLFFHEFAHAVHMWGVTGETGAEIKKAHAADMKRPEKSGLGGYADTDRFEHFAQAASVYFGVGYLNEKPAELSKKDPEMSKIVEKIFDATGRKP